MAFYDYIPGVAGFKAGKKLVGHQKKQMEKLMGSFSGSKSQLKKFDQFTSQQKKVFHDFMKRINPKALDLMKSPLFQQSQKYISDLMSPTSESFEKFKKPIMSQFQQEIVPGIAERFAGMGALNSSGFNQAMGAAGTGLAERLGSLREGMRMQGASMGANLAQMPVNNMMNMVNTGFGAQPYGYQAFAGQPGFMQSLAGGAGQALGALGPLALMALL